MSFERFENVRWERLGTRRPHNWSDTNLRAGQREGEKGEGWNGKGVEGGEGSALVLLLKDCHSFEVLQIGGLPVLELVYI